MRWAGSKDWPTTKWLVQDLIPTASTGLFVGESQAGKSFTCINLAGCLAVGKPFFGKEIKEPGGTIYICAEGSSCVKEKLDAETSGSIIPYLKQLNPSGAVDTPKLPIAVVYDIPDLVHPDNAESLIGKIVAVAEEMQKRHAVSLRLVIIDTMLSAIGIDERNNASQARLAMAVLQKIHQATGAVALGVHHHGKEKARGAAGSFAFTAIPDFILSVHKNDENGKVKRRWIETTKLRSGETDWTCDFDLTGIQIDLDAQGNEIYCPFVEPRPEGSSKDAGNVGGARESKGLTALKKALDDARRSNGMTEFDDGKFRGTRKEALRLGFDRHYKGKTDEANRKAFDRALKLWIEKSEIVIKTRDGDDWACELTPAKEEGENGKRHLRLAHRA